MSMATILSEHPTKFLFSKAALDKLPIPTKDECGKTGYRMVWDEKLIGFGLTVRPSGTKTFILSYRTEGGRSRRFTIGKYGRLTVEQAREAAKQRNGEVALGGDPVIERDTLRETPTLN